MSDNIGEMVGKTLVDVHASEDALTFKAKEYLKGKKMSDYLAESHLYREFSSSDGMMLAGRQIDRM